MESILKIYTVNIRREINEFYKFYQLRIAGTQELAWRNQWWNVESLTQEEPPQRSPLRDRGQKTRRDMHRTAGKWARENASYSWMWHQQHQFW